MDESLNSTDYSDGMSALHYYIQLNILISQHNIYWARTRLHVSVKNGQSLSGPNYKYTKGRGVYNCISGLKCQPLLMSIFNYKWNCLTFC